MKPFIKWVGGKRQLLKHLNKKAPIKFNRYIEPFLGGGAFFLFLESKKAILNDFNKELINTWEIIKKHKKKLIYILNNFIELEVNRNIFNSKRDEFNNLKPKTIDEKIRKAALFIFLNKSCYNGLYRVTLGNKFNVPWNKKTKIFVNIEEIKKISNFLNKNKINLYSEDFSKILNKAKKGDFVYIDPPYDLLKKNTFNSYSSKIFTLEDQKRLANHCKKLTKKGVFIIISNHDTENIRNFYNDFNIEIVSVNRCINSNGIRRKGHFEVLITNYNEKTQQIKKIK